MQRAVFCWRSQFAYLIHQLFPHMGALHPDKPAHLLCSSKLNGPTHLSFPASGQVRGESFEICILCPPAQHINFSDSRHLTVLPRVVAQSSDKKERCRPPQLPALTSQCPTESPLPGPRCKVSEKVVFISVSYVFVGLWINQSAYSWSADLEPASCGIHVPCIVIIISPRHWYIASADGRPFRRVFPLRPAALFGAFVQAQMGVVIWHAWPATTFVSYLIFFLLVALL